MTVRYRGRHFFDRIGANYIEGLPQMILGVQYFVSANNGADTNDGTNPSFPLATIAAAITKSNATIDWSATPKKYNVIWVEPGVYAENLTPPYYCHVIGLGVRGTDTEAEIHPTTGDCLAGTLLGTGLHNLHFEVDAQDAECIDGGIVNNSIITDCLFTKGANVTGVNGISTENCSHLTVKNCSFESGQLTNIAYAIYAAGGTDKFFHNCRIENNKIFAATMGIYIASNCTASQAIIEENVIYVDGTGTGIDGYGGGADTGGAALAVRNKIIIAGAGDAIHGLAAGQKLYNMTNVNGSYAQETA